MLGVALSQNSHSVRAFGSQHRGWMRPCRAGLRRKITVQTARPFDLHSSFPAPCSPKTSFTLGTQQTSRLLRLPQAQNWAQDKILLTNNSSQRRRAVFRPRLYNHRYRPPAYSLMTLPVTTGLFSYCQRGDVNQRYRDCATVNY